MPDKLHIWAIELETGTLVIPAKGNIPTNSVFYAFFVLEL